MRQTRNLVVLTSAVVVSVMALGAAAIATNDNTIKDLTPRAALDRGNPPPQPAWIGDDGSVDHARAPECVEAVGPDGLTITKGNGEPVCIPFKALHGPPPAGPPGDVEKANRGAREIDGPNGEKIMIVPEQRPAAIAR